MTMIRRTGSWRAKTLAGQPNPNLGDGIDARHLHPVEERPAVPMPAHQLPAERSVLFAADDFALPVEYQLDVTPPMDRSPAEDHATGGAARGGEAGAHNEDLGGPDKAHYSWPSIIREDDSSYRTERTEMAVQVSQSRGQVTQGIDRDGVSPQGHAVMRWIDRPFRRRTISADAYPIWSYRAAVPKQSPALPAGQGNQYLSPFDKIIGIKRRRVAIPEVRRQPPPYADQEAVDGLPASTTSYWEW
jgi:hypothetical protein